MVNAKIIALLAGQGIAIADCVYCPHHPDDGCSCRKPKTGLWDMLSQKYHLDPSGTVFVGNRSSDVDCAKAIGCLSIRIYDEHPMTSLPDIIVDDLLQLATFLQKNSSLDRPLKTLEEVVTLSLHSRRLGKIIITTNGTFDLLHPGHQFLLSESRKYGDVLIVGVNSDASVRRYKGPNRPYESQEIRARKVAAFADAVFIFDADDPRPWLPHIRPHIHVNAETYGEECIESNVLSEIGAKLVLVPVHRELGSTSEKIRTRLV
jgi:rfaE bifunctional protein nucleotidyltransferase chain/domain